MATLSFSLNKILFWMKKSLKICLKEQRKKIKTTKNVSLSHTVKPIIHSHKTVKISKKKIHERILIPNNYNESKGSRQKYK